MNRKREIARYFAEPNKRNIWSIEFKNKSVINSLSLCSGLF